MPADAEAETSTGNLAQQKLDKEMALVVAWFWITGFFVTMYHLVVRIGKSYLCRERQFLPYYVTPDDIEYFALLLVPSVYLLATTTLLIYWVIVDQSIPSPKERTYTLTSIISGMHFSLIIAIAHGILLLAANDPRAT